MIAHPPCTYLCSSGLHWNKRRPERAKQPEEALDFVRLLLDAPIPRIALENPIGCISTRIRKPDQTIQPWQFGHEAQKTTCLWLKNLPNLEHTNVVGKGEFYTTPTGKKMPSWMSDPVGADGKKLAYGSAEIKKVRNKTFQGIADAMANQWGVL